MNNKTPNLIKIGHSGSVIRLQGKGSIDSSPSRMKVSLERTPLDISMFFREMMNNNSITNLESMFKKLSKRVLEFCSMNKASIFSTSNIIPQIKSLGTQFDRFFLEVNKYCNQLTSAKDEEEFSKINIAAMKATSIEFNSGWIEFVENFEKIHEHGLYSIAEYMTSLFQEIIHIINEITNNDRRNTVHRDALKKTGGSLIQIALSFSDGLKHLLSKKELIKGKPELQTKRINDIKGYLRFFNELSYTDFPKSGLLQSELSQHKAMFNSTVNTILNTIKFGFSFDDEMISLVSEISCFGDMFFRIVRELQLPITIYRKNDGKRQNEKKKTENRDIDKKDDDDPVVNTVLGKSVTALISEVSNIGGLLLRPQSKIYEKFDAFRDFVLDSIDKLKSLEIQISILMKKNENQSDAMNEIIADNAKREEEHAKTVKNLEKQNQDLKNVILSLEEKLEDERSTIKFKNHIIEELRSQIDSKQINEAVQKVGKRMSEIMTGCSNNTLLPKPDDLNYIENMNLFVLERRCTKCNEYEKITSNIRKQIKTVITMPNDISFLSLSETLINKYQEKESSLKNLEKEHANLKSDHSKIMESCYKLFHDFQKITMNEENVLPPKNSEEMAIELQNSFKKLNDHYMSLIQSTEEEFVHQYQQNMEEIVKPMLHVCKSRSEKFENPIAYLRVITSEYVGKFNSLEEENQKQTKLLKAVEKWMNIKSGFNTEGMRIDQALLLMMKTIDNTPNPLQEVVNQLTADHGFIFKELKGIVEHLDVLRNCPKIEAIGNDIKPFIPRLKEHVDSIYNDLHAKEFVISQMKSQIYISRSTLVQITKDFGKILHHTDSVSDLQLDPLILRLSLYCDEICGPNGNHYFFPVEELNIITQTARELFKSEISPQPRQYISKIVHHCVVGIRTSQAVSQLEGPIREIFEQFDLGFESFDPHSISFPSIREKFFVIHQLMNEIFNDALYSPIVEVISKLMSLTSLFLSTIVHLSN